MRIANLCPSVFIRGSFSFKMPPMRIALLVLVAGLVGCATKQSFDVSVRNNTDQPLTVGFVKIGTPADPAWAPPESWYQLPPSRQPSSWGIVVDPGTTRGALVARLAEALGHPEARAQVEEHVHELETGQLPPARVRPPVVAALARILQVPEALLEVGRRIAPPPVEASRAPLFHRAAPMVAPPPSAAEDHDEAPRIPEIDDLFTGGG